MNPFACTPADGEADHGVAGARPPSRRSARRGRRRRRTCRRSRARRRGRSRAARPSRRRRARRPPRGTPRRRPRRARPPPRARSARRRRSRAASAASRPVVSTSLMQCAARSAPQARSAPRARASISFVPTPSVDAASKRRSSSGCEPGERAESGRAGRLDRGPQPLHHRVRDRERHTRGRVAVRRRVRRRVYGAARRGSPGTGTHGCGVGGRGDSGRPPHGSLNPSPALSPSSRRWRAGRAARRPGTSRCARSRSTCRGSS